MPQGILHILHLNRRNYGIIAIFRAGASQRSVNAGRHVLLLDWCLLAILGISLEHLHMPFILNIHACQDTRAF